MASQRGCLVQRKPQPGEGRLFRTSGVLGQGEVGKIVQSQLPEGTECQTRELWLSLPSSWKPGMVLELEPLGARGKTGAQSWRRPS